MSRDITAGDFTRVIEKSSTRWYLPPAGNSGSGPMNIFMWVPGSQVSDINIWGMNLNSKIYFVLENWDSWWLVPVKFATNTCFQLHVSWLWRQTSQWNSMHFPYKFLPPKTSNLRWIHSEFWIEIWQMWSACNVLPTCQIWFCPHNLHGSCTNYAD